MVEKHEFDQILKDVLRELENCEEGVLYQAIKILYPDNVEEIRDSFSINPYASHHEDLQVLEQLQIFQPFLKLDIANIRSNKLFFEFFEFFLEKIMDIRVVIVLIIIATVLGGLYFRGKQPKPPTPLPPPSPPSSKAALCLVIPCNRITQSLRDQLKIDGKLHPHDTVSLIDESIYFIADEPETIKEYGSRLNLNKNNWQNFPEGGDLCIQLSVPKGEAMINLKLKRRLSQAVPPNVQITIKEIGLLNDFNNLEPFIRA